jgi:CXXX repeat modification system protein
MQVIGKITESEKEEINQLYLKKTALMELLYGIKNIKRFDENIDELYEKVVKDLGETTEQYTNWFASKKEKYQWETHANYSFTVLFKTNEVALAKIPVPE